MGHYMMSYFACSCMCCCSALSSALWMLQGAARTIVFCNKITTCRKVENLLNRAKDSWLQSAQVIAYHAAIPDDQRQAALQVGNYNVNHQQQPPKSLFACLLKAMSNSLTRS